MNLPNPEDLYAGPKHPYTEALLSAVPVPDPEAAAAKARIMLEGEVPSPDQHYPGCAFAERCPVRIDRCDADRPELPAKPHAAACWVRDAPAEIE